MIDLVVKVGGSLIARREQLDAVLATLSRLARVQRLLVVPGGGPLADVVREIDRRMDIGDDAAHWMAVLAMDQFAYLIASRVADSRVVEDHDAIGTALADGVMPVLAPSRWLRAADPLPHSWDVTSDSIAAWVAGQVGAPRLVLIKAPGATGTGLVDAAFGAALPPGVHAETVSADSVSIFRWSPVA